MKSTTLARASGIGIFKMKSIRLITYEIIWRCVQPLIVVGIAVKRFFPNPHGLQIFMNSISASGHEIAYGLFDFRMICVALCSAFGNRSRRENFHDSNRATVS